MNSDDSIKELKETIQSQKEAIELLVEELEKHESKNDYKLTHKCDFTDSGMINDCGIDITFGYGSNRDLQSFSFKNVSDGIGEKVLKLLNDSFENGKSIRDFCHNSLGGTTNDIDLPTEKTIYNAVNNIQE